METGIPLLIIAVILSFLFLLAGVALGKKLGRAQTEAGLRAETDAAREDAIRRSRNTLLGQISEQLAPYFPGFPFDPSDARFLGKPVDFVVFPGLSAGKPEGAVFVEVKSSASRLSQTERILRDAIKAGRVSWLEFRLPVKGKRLK